MRTFIIFIGWLCLIIVWRLKLINLLVFYVTCISFASVQHYFQIVPLCNGVL